MSEEMKEPGFFNPDLRVNTVRRAAASELADYKVPERILIVAELPRNALQKADKPRIRALVEKAIG